MKDTQILSAFQELERKAARELEVENAVQQKSRSMVFDACHLGVVLRAVLFVEAVTAVGAMYGATDFIDWLTRLSLLAGGALPATLVWLIAACSLKKKLAQLSQGLQYAVGILLGAVAGLYGCAVLAMVGLIGPTPWLASAFTGAGLAAVMVAALVLRAKGMTPAATSARLAELQSRIRPHFLFNSLNSAIALVRAEPSKAETLLEDLSDLFRHALVDQGESVTLADEIALAKRYLAIEQIRFGDRLKLQWNIDPACDNATLPPLLLQPLVENAVRHGVEPSVSGATVRVTTQRRGSIVVIKVSNTVPSGPGERGHGVALSNVRDRLKLLHDVQGQFQSALKDGVFQVRIEVPL